MPHATTHFLVINPLAKHFATSYATTLSGCKSKKYCATLDG